MLCATAQLDEARQDPQGTSTATCAWAPGRHESAQRHQSGRAASGGIDATLDHDQCGLPRDVARGVRLYRRVAGGADTYAEGRGRLDQGQL